MNIFIHFIDIITLLVISTLIFALIFNRKYKLALACFIIFTVLCFSSIGLAKAQTVKHIHKQDIGKFTAKEFYWWSNRTMEYFTGKSKLKIDQFSKVIKYDLNKGWVLIYSKIPEIVSVIDVFGGDYKKVKIVKGYNLINFSGVKGYAGLKVLIISSPWGFAILKQQSDTFGFKDVAYVILKSELAEFAWQRVAIALVLFLIGLAYARFVKLELLEWNRARQLVYYILAIILIFAALGISYHKDTITIVQDNSTVKKTIDVLTFSTYQIKDFYNYLYALVFAIGYVVGLGLFRNEELTLIKPLMDRIEVRTYPFNAEKGVIRDEHGEIVKISFSDSIGKFTVVENGYLLDGFVEIDRKVYELEKAKIEFTNRKVLAVCFGVLALIFLGNLLNVFRIDVPSTFIIVATLFALLNLRNFRDYLLMPKKVIHVESTELITNDRYYADLLNGKLIEMAKTYNLLKRDLIKKEFEIDYKVAKEIFSIARSLEVIPEPSEGSNNDVQS